MAKKEVNVSAEKAPEKGAPPAFYPLSTLRDEFDRAFGRMLSDWPRFGWLGDFDPFREMGLRTTAPAPALTPRVDVSEDEKAYEIEAEIPGVDEKDLSVTVTDGRLTLRGEKKDEKEEKKKDYYMKERSYGAFERSFRLPDGVDTGKISAAFENGVLHVTLPKSAKAKSNERKIAIKTK